jgi:serine phosphatase RsbU (regulator of sigma subunit)
VLTLDDGALGISIGDVVGKGLPAATVMSQLRSAVEVIARTSEAPAAVVDRVDSYAGRLPDATGSTLLYLLLEPDGKIDWCSAGHLPPLVLHGGKAAYLDAPQRGPLASRAEAARRVHGGAARAGEPVAALHGRAAAR